MKAGASPRLCPYAPDRTFNNRETGPELPVSSPSVGNSRSGKPLTAVILRYSLAALSVGAAALLMVGMRELAADARPALLLAVAVSALYLGLGAALFSLAVATFVAPDVVMLLTGAVLDR